MGFLSEHFGKDYSKVPKEELYALKKENEERAIESESLNQEIVDHMPVWLLRPVTDGSGKPAGLFG